LVTKAFVMKNNHGIWTLTMVATIVVEVCMLVTSCRNKCCNDEDLLALAELTTDTVSAITQTTAQCGGSISSDGGANITARGVCWSNLINPTISDHYSNDSSRASHFTSYLTGLTPDTLYYVRAYATNSVGTAYGNQQSFTTLQNATIPVLTTDGVTVITQTTANSGGNVTSDGGNPVTARGVCWSTSPDPTTTDSYTTDGSGTGPFTSYLTGLTPNTPYYVRAYATNSVGTSYGNEQSFTTLDLSCPGIPTVTYGGQIYNTVQIGTQCWLKENLNIGTRIDGSMQQTNNSTIEKYCYDDLVSNCDVYGGQYQWDEMMQYATTPGVQGICPPGWHGPTDAEWTTLTTFLAGEAIAGGKMKEAGTAHWSSPNTGATNSSGFTALPGGSRTYNGNFGNDLTYFAYFWSSSQYSAPYAWFRRLVYDDENVLGGWVDKTAGYSARCVMD